MAYDVFISYRRETGADDARLLQQALKARGYNVFFDYDSLRDGKFDEKIFEAIDEAPVFVLMLTERALDRCVNADDWVRVEIERALSSGKKIISVAPSDQKWSFPENLPDSLCAIKTEQASELNKASLFDESIDKMIKNRFPVPLYTGESSVSNKIVLNENGHATNVKKQLFELLSRLYDITTAYRMSLREGNEAGFMKSTSEMCDSLQKLYFFAERNRRQSKEVSAKAMLIIDQYNSFVPYYNTFADSANRMSEEAQNAARFAEMEYNKFVELILQIMQDVKTESI